MNQFLAGSFTSSQIACRLSEGQLFRPLSRRNHYFLKRDTGIEDNLFT
jgi:hypothetical protein